MKRVFIVALLFSLTAHAGNWPNWRGPDSNGTSPDKNLPVKWSDTDKGGENITWKLPVKSRSGATPIIWGDYIFLNTAEADFEGNLEIWCVDRNKGEVLWKRPMGGGNMRARKQNMSSPSPVTDGKTVWVLTGTGVLKAFDFKGNELWARNIQDEYGKFGLNWGYGSSPTLFENTLFVQVLHGMRTKDPSYLLRLDAKTGKTMWRVERPTPAIQESPDSYTTPSIFREGTRTELVVTGGDVMTGHDVATGKEVWRAGGFNPQNRRDFRVI